ncbi:MAG: hypothetical protein AAGF85_02930 [Bacteroidota bacterium]
MNEFCWGTDSKSTIQRYVNETGNLVYADGLIESQMDDKLSICLVLPIIG